VFIHAVEFKTKVQKRKQINAYMIQREEVPCIGLNVNPVRKQFNHFVRVSGKKKRKKGILSQYSAKA
jgi:hypothetical protein